MNKLQNRIIRIVIGIIFVVSIFIDFGYAYPGKNKRFHIAVLDFEARSDVDTGEAASLSDIFCSNLVQTGQYIVVDRNRIKAILMEQGFQRTEACSSVECIVEAGKILKVEKIFAGTIGKIGRLYTVNIQMIDVTTAHIQSNKSRQHSGDIEDLATTIIPEIASEITTELTGEEIYIAQQVSSRRYKRHEFFVGFGGGDGENIRFFQNTPDVKIKVNGYFSIAYFFNISRYFAGGIRISNFHDYYEGFLYRPLLSAFVYRQTLELSCNTVSLEGRVIFVRSTFEPYICAVLAKIGGRISGEGDNGGMKEVGFDGGGGGLGLGVKALITDNFGLALEGRAIGSTVKWSTRYTDEGFYTEQEKFNISHRVICLMLFAQF